MAFNWDDQPLVEPTAEPSVVPTPVGFDWNQHPVAEMTEAAPPVQAPDADIYSAESFIRSAAQVPTLGFADEGIAGLRAGWDIATTDKTMSDAEKLYTAYRDVERRKNKNAEEANPWASRAGMVAGAIGTAMIPGLNIASIPAAATLGAVSGLGSSDADLTKLNKGELKSAAVDTVIGGVLGGATQAVLPAVGRTLSGMKDSLKKRGAAWLEDGAEKVFAGGLKPRSADLTEFRSALNFQDKNTVNTLAKQAEEEFSEISYQKLVDDYVKVKGGPKEIEKSAQGRIDEIEARKKELFNSASWALNSAPPVERQLKIEQLRQTKINLPGQLDDIANDAAKSQTDLSVEERTQLAARIKDIFKGYLNPVTKLPEIVDGKVMMETAEFAAKDPVNISAMDDLKKLIGEDISEAGFKKLKKIEELEKTPQGAALLKAKRDAYLAVRNHITAIGDIMGDKIGTSIKRANLEESNLIKIRELAHNATNKEILDAGGGMGTGMAMKFGAGSVGALVGSVLGPVGAVVGAGTGLAGKWATEQYLGQGLEKAAKIGVGRTMQGVGKKMLGAADTLEPLAPKMQVAGDFIEKHFASGTASPIAQRSPFRDKKDTTNLATFDDDQLSGAASILQSSGDGKLKNYGDALAKALQSKDPQAKNAAIFLILQNKNAKQKLGLTNKGQ